MRLFGFPTGYGLLQKVLDITNPNNLSNETSRAFQFYIENGAFVRFHNELLKCGKQSVDAFLEHRPEFIPIGKIAMAIALIPCEDENILFKRDGKSWYEYLFNRLNAKFEDFDKNKLSILTFNYDRSLEHYLFTALHNSYGKKPEECADKLKSLPIIHLHGDLGELPHFVTNGMMRPYSAKLYAHSMQVASERIKIIHEGIDYAAQFVQAKTILLQSEIVCFLGFGYHPLNLRRLDFHEDYYKKAAYYGSSFGMTPAECNNVGGIFKGKLALELNQNAKGQDILDFLRHSSFLQVG